MAFKLWIFFHYLQFHHLAIIMGTHLESFIMKFHLNNWK